MRSTSLGKWIRARRDEVGLTQAELAEAIGRTQPVVSRWERDKASPGSDLMAPLVKALRTTYVALADAVLDVCTDTERAIVADSALRRKEQDALLAAYGALTGRPSLDYGAFLRARPEDDGP